MTGGHPGDPEYACGGTIARYTDLGHEVTLLYLNKGEGGCPHKTAQECSATRVAEAEKACEILKAHPAFAGRLTGSQLSTGLLTIGFKNYSRPKSRMLCSRNGPSMPIRIAAQFPCSLITPGCIWRKTSPLLLRSFGRRRYADVCANRLRRYFKHWNRATRGLLRPRIAGPGPLLSFATPDHHVSRHPSRLLAS